MPNSSRTLLVVTVLSVGACTASLFRKPAGTEPTSTATEPLFHRAAGPNVVNGPTQFAAAPPNEAAAQSAQDNTRPSARVRPPRATLATDNRPPSPPELPSDSPIGGIPGGGLPIGPATLRDAGIDGGPGAEDLLLADDAGEPVRRLPDGGVLHRVVDGDTVSNLATRYLGDANRGEEIVAANRDSVSSSGALRIGVDLKIPPRNALRRSPIRASPISTGPAGPPSASSVPPSPNPPIVPDAAVPMGESDRDPAAWRSDESAAPANSTPGVEAIRPARSAGVDGVAPGSR